MMESMRNLHIVLFIGVMCVVQTMAQVCPITYQGCWCDYNSVSCGELTQMPPLNTGPNVTQVSDLIFKFGNITSISINSLPPALASISLEGHPLTNISEDAFDTSAATLQYIEFMDANFTSLPTALKKLTNLTSLTIENTRIQNWDTATLTKIATTLKTLVLINVGLYTWPSWIVDFHLLRKLDLSRNTLNSIPDDAFSSINNSLRHLDLSGTGLTHLPQALYTLSSIGTLYLNNNNFTVSEIEKITELPFAQMLSYLSLDTTGLSRLANFSNLTDLINLKLSGNRISNPPAGLLPTALNYVYFNDNYLWSVPTDIADMSSLSALLIERNHITYILPNSFPLSLTYLSMSGNRVGVFENTTFRNLTLLTILQLSDNPIRIIYPEAFSDLVSLRLLYMSDTLMFVIPLAFARLNSRVQIYYYLPYPLGCSCPVEQELLQWYTSFTGTLNTGFNTCRHGQSIDSYLRVGQCRIG